MLITEMINQLQKLKDEHGDLPILIAGRTYSFPVESIKSEVNSDDDGTSFYVAALFNNALP